MIPFLHPNATISVLEWKQSTQGSSYFQSFWKRIYEARTSHTPPSLVAVSNTPPSVRGLHKNFTLHVLHQCFVTYAVYNLSMMYRSALKLSNTKTRKHMFSRLFQATVLTSFNTLLSSLSRLPSNRVTVHDSIRHSQHRRSPEHRKRFLPKNMQQEQHLPR